MQQRIKDRLVHRKPGLYTAVLFPIATSFLLTFISARLINNLWPDLFLVYSGVHIHHFAYGFFVLAASGYLALIFNGPRASFWIALLHGMGLGLALDEMAMWLHLDASDEVRWRYDGFSVFGGLVLFILSAKPGVRLIQKALGFGRSQDA